MMLNMKPGTMLFRSRGGSKEVWVELPYTSKSVPCTRISKNDVVLVLASKFDNTKTWPWVFLALTADGRVGWVEYTHGNWEKLA